MMTILVIPCYNEHESLPVFLGELIRNWNVEDPILIADDSNESSHEQICEYLESLRIQGHNIGVIRGSTKRGRGAAVNEAMKFALSNFRNFDYLIEADADGSHRPYDVILMRDYQKESDLLIGSRYLKDSRIMGWSLSRRAMSKFLNFIIPKVLLIRVSDITNGLRRYSHRGVTEVCSFSSLTSGFVYLSEQALYIKKKKMKIMEVPIVFMPRLYGSSTVTLRDLVSSLLGIIKIITISISRK